jgi:hypothetical protein
MKKLIIACLAAVALLSLSACTTANDERSAPAYHPAPPAGHGFPSAPIITDPHLGIVQ